MAFVPPAVADAKSQQALDIAADTPDGPANIRVARSAKRRRIAEGLLASGAITEAEYGDHELFHARCSAAVVAGEEAPAWSGPALTAGLSAGLTAGLSAGLSAGLAPINERLAAIEANLADVEASLVNVKARQSNAVTVHQDDVLIPLNNAAGDLDPGFPATLQALNGMNGPALAASLGFYGVEVGDTVEDCRDRFKKFIGIRL